MTLFSVSGVHSFIQQIAEAADSCDAKMLYGMAVGYAVAPWDGRIISEQEKDDLLALANQSVNDRSLKIAARGALMATRLPKCA